MLERKGREFVFHSDSTSKLESLYQKISWGYFGKTPESSGIYLYTPTENELSPSIRVAKTSERPEQTIIGPKNSVRTISNSLRLLDNFYSDKSHRRMNIVVSCNYNFSNSEHITNKNGHYFSWALLEKFGLLDGIDIPAYKNYVAARKSLHGVLVATTVPIFYTPDYSNLSSNGHSERALVLLWAAIIKHEDVHVQQHNNKLPSYSLWAERQAISEDCYFIQRALNAGFIDNHHDEWFFETHLRNSSQRIENYRNGTGFQDHLKKELFQEGPLNSFIPEVEDFAYGR